MVDGAAGQPDSVKCPVCGAEAEAGCIYGPDGWTGLRWRAGPPSALGNLETQLWGGDLVGKWGLLRGPYIEGLRCKHCKHIVMRL